MAAKPRKSAPKKKAAAKKKPKTFWEKFSALGTEPKEAKMSNKNAEKQRKAAAPKKKAAKKKAAKKKGSKLYKKQNW